MWLDPSVERVKAHSCAVRWKCLCRGGSGHAVIHWSMWAKRPNRFFIPHGGSLSFYATDRGSSRKSSTKKVLSRLREIGSACIKWTLENTNWLLVQKNGHYFVLAVHIAIYLFNLTLGPTKSLLNRYPVREPFGLPSLTLYESVVMTVLMETRMIQMGGAMSVSAYMYRLLLTA